MLILRLSVLVSLCLVGGALGCTGDVGRESELGPGENVENVGTAVQAFTAQAPYALYATTEAEIRMAPVTTHTCYLTGVYGSMNYGDVKIEPVGSHWFLRVEPTSNRKLGGTAVCIQTVANRTARISSSGPPVVLGPIQPGRRCFLTAVRAAHPVYSYNDTSDVIRTYTSNGNWYLGGEGTTGATASCIDVALSDGSWEYGGNNPLTISVIADAPGRQCFLSAIGGRFVLNDWSSSVSVERNASASAWQVKASGTGIDSFPNGGKIVGARCAR